MDATSQIDREFVANAVAFLDDAFRRSRKALLIATAANAQAIRARLEKHLEAAPNQLATVDALDLVDELTEEGIPDELQFREAVGRLISSVEPGPNGVLHVVSELPSLAGRVKSLAVAAEIAGLWEGLARRYAHCEFMVDFAQTIKLMPEDLEALRAS
jgi:hypothetical protein